MSRDMIRREPENPEWHKFHNDLLYRLRHPDYLKSYDTAPKTADLLLSKAFFLSHEKRAEEALEAYNRAAALEPDNRQAAARHRQCPDHAGPPWRSRWPHWTGCWRWTQQMPNFMAAPRRRRC